MVSLKLREAMSKLIKFIASIAFIAALSAIFGLYGRPEFLMTIANQLWTCF